MSRSARMRSRSGSGALTLDSRGTANGLGGMAGCSVRTISSTYRSNVCRSIPSGTFHGSGGGCRRQFCNNTSLQSSSSVLRLAIFFRVTFSEDEGDFVNLSGESSPSSSSQPQSDSDFESRIVELVKLMALTVIVRSQVTLQHGRQHGAGLQHGCGAQGGLRGSQGGSSQPHEGLGAHDEHEFDRLPLSHR